MSQKLTNEKARELLKELQYAKAQMGGQLSIRDEYFKQALERLPHWIACSEQIPDLEQEVLIIDEYSEQHVAKYTRSYTGRGSPLFFAEHDVIDATHWMPLPEAPL